MRKEGRKEGGREGGEQLEEELRAGLRREEEERPCEATFCVYFPSEHFSQALPEG